MKQALVLVLCALACVASAQVNGWVESVAARTNVVTAARIDDVYVKVETNGAHYAYVDVSLVDAQGAVVTRKTVDLDEARISALLGAAGTDVPHLMALLLYLGGTGAASMDRLIISPPAAWACPKRRSPPPARSPIATTTPPTSRNSGPSPAPVT
jgi:hypothetical protein